MTHTELINAGVEYLNARGFFVWKNNTGTQGSRHVRFGKKGSGDLIGMFPDGRFIAGEAKILPDKQSDDQQIFQAECEKRNAIYILYYDIDELQSKLVPYMKVT